MRKISHPVLPLGQPPSANQWWPNSPMFNSPTPPPAAAQLIPCPPPLPPGAAQHLTATTCRCSCFAISGQHSAASCSCWLPGQGRAGPPCCPPATSAVPVLQADRAALLAIQGAVPAAAAAAVPVQPCLAAAPDLQMHLASPLADCPGCHPA
jgi:hypothetical protein